MANRKGGAAAKRQEAPKAETQFPSTEQLIADGFNTKSARIRELGRLGMKTGDIARQETNGLYQHAYNVLHRKPKRPANQPAAEQPASQDNSGAETDASA